MSQRPQLVAWDFDGVLNANIQDGRFIWADDLEADLGIDRAHLQAYIFASKRFREVLTGGRDFLDLLAAFLADGGYDVPPERLMQYWFEKDAHPDAGMLDLVRRVACRQVIATNNEAHRAAFIWEEMGYQAHMERVFAAGPMGVAKPDAGFFEEITGWAGLAPGVCLLVDDAKANVEAAAALGWQTFYLTETSRAALAGYLQDMGLIA